jgi:D-sedoheptulose 7-phosphate isomerase
MTVVRGATDLSALVAARFEQSTTVPETFFTAAAEQIAQACWAMAKRFHQGGRLIAFGNGAWASDAQHISVEFVHPVIVGKRALPALALTNDTNLFSDLSSSHNGGPPFAHQLAVLARQQDIALGLSPDGLCAKVGTALAVAQKKGLLTVGLAGGEVGEMAHNNLDFCFIVPSSDPFVIQETHETLYHILWELVHIFFEHEGLLV